MITKLATLVMSAKRLVSLLAILVGGNTFAQTAPLVRIPAFKPIGVSIPDCVQELLETLVTTNTVTYVVSDVRLDGCKGRMVIQGPPLPPGTYSATARFRSGETAGGFVQPFIVEPPPVAVPVFALFDSRTSTYFVTASESDRSLLRSQGWTVADAGFTAWPSNGPAPETSKPVCRFFFPAKSTHFYTANENDCATLKRTPGFVDEGIAFRALVPFGGRCGPGTQPVYRLFNSERVNHRYTVSSDTASGMLASFTSDFYVGAYPSPWADDGITFCSPIL